MSLEHRIKNQQQFVAVCPPHLGDLAYLNFTVENATSDYLAADASTQYLIHAINLDWYFETAVARNGTVMIRSAGAIYFRFAYIFGGAQYQAGSKICSFFPPLFISNGLYLRVSSNGTDMVIQGSVFYETITVGGVG